MYNALNAINFKVIDSLQKVICPSLVVAILLLHHFLWVLKNLRKDPLQL